MTAEPRNRIAAAIERTRPKVAALSPADAATLEAGLAVDFSDHFDYQETQARAHAAGRISTAEAEIIYRALGEIGAEDNGGWAAGADLATKVIVTQIIGELLGLRAGR